MAGDEISVPKNVKPPPDRPLVEKETTLEAGEKIPEEKMYAEADMFPEPDVEEVDELNPEEDSDRELRDIEQQEDEGKEDVEMEDVGEVKQDKIGQVEQVDLEVEKEEAKQAEEID